MINETNFKDIRRNYITASILLILFLIYGGKITINKIFLFDLTGNWAIISPFWDVLIFLFIFFFYTFLRYLIYGYEKIKNNGYKKIFLFELLNNLIVKGGQYTEENKYIKTSIVYNLQEKEYNKKSEIRSIQANYNEKTDRQFYLSALGRNYELQDGKIKKEFQWGSHIHLFSISDLIIMNNKIEFTYLEQNISGKNKVILEFYKNINKFYPNKIKIILTNKEFSDFIWPLLLLIIIYILIIGKITFYFYK